MVIDNQDCAFLNKFETFKMLSDHSEFDSSMKIRLYK